MPSAVLVKRNLAMPREDTREPPATADEEGAMRLLMLLPSLV